MNVVITMAGLGSRFADAGYTVPKYEIQAGGKTLMEWSLDSLKAFEGEDALYIFITRKALNSVPFLQQICHQRGIPAYHIVELEEKTDGQATTALMARSVWDAHTPLLIHNIDTYVEPGYINRAQCVGEGHIPCFRGEGDHWSFVQINREGLAVRVTEKERISGHCSVGAYYFSSAALYEQAYDGLYGGSTEIPLKEKYIAPMYQWLIGQGAGVTISDIPANRVHVLGTPEELNVFRQELSRAQCAATER